MIHGLPYRITVAAVVFLLVVSASASTAHAQNIQPQIYAYPGHSCPEGSRLLKGPETKRAEASGAVYCVFERLAFTFAKAKFGAKCPAGHEPYHDEKFQPEADTLWCTRLKPQDIVLPPGNLPLPLSPGSAPPRRTP